MGESRQDKPEGLPQPPEGTTTVAIIPEGGNMPLEAYVQRFDPGRTDVDYWSRVMHCEGITVAALRHAYPNPRPSSRELWWARHTVPDALHWPGDTTQPLVTLFCDSANLGRISRTNILIEASDGHAHDASQFASFIARNVRDGDTLLSIGIAYLRNDGIVGRYTPFRGMLDTYPVEQKDK